MGFSSQNGSEICDYPSLAPLSRTHDAINLRILLWRETRCYVYGWDHGIEQGVSTLGCTYMYIVTKGSTLSRDVVITNRFMYNCNTTVPICVTTSRCLLNSCYG